MPFDPHFPTAHRVAADEARVRNNFATARQAEILPQMRFLRRAWRKKFHAFGDFHEAFLAFALLAAGSGNLDAHHFRAIEKRLPRREILLMKVEV